ncbi:dihydroneopterin aldolase [Nigerium sp.]|uniref:dihydroneopterin aldolase n=1 Tax=Nigerium sp. TaxID=2042655 RepID=UPI00322146E6
MTADLTGALLGTNADLVTLTGVSAVGHHGVFAHEKRDGQTFVVDVTCRLRRPAREDRLETTVDYGALAGQVVALIEGGPYDLIETLADVIADACLAQPLVDAAVVTVHKPEAPMPVRVADAAVTVARVR